MGSGRLRVAAVGTFYRRYENTLPLLRRILVESARRPDVTFVLCETDDDMQAAYAALDVIGCDDGVDVEMIPTPTLADGRYEMVPYSRKHNWALRQIKHNDLADLIVYVDNDSMPHPDKYRVMAEALEEHPDWGAVYCTQQRSGWSDVLEEASEPVEDGYCVLNHTQVMHRKCRSRWPLQMEYAAVGDGIFWRSLHAEFGLIWPCGGLEPLDEHHQDTPASVGGGLAS